MSISPEEIIKRLELKPLPQEGGYFRETYKSTDSLLAGYFGLSSKSHRRISTAIYYLITPDSFSALHRLTSDEIFHFYAGDAVDMFTIDNDGNSQIVTIGNQVLSGETPQVIVPRGVWQGLKIKEGGKWALMGTTVAPGFDYEDFELSERTKLISLYPEHAEAIIQYTR